MKPTDKPNFLAVDFYCGAGGTTRGLLDAGGYVIAGIDKDESCRATYQRNNQNTTLDRAAPPFLALDMFPRSPDYPQGQRGQVWKELNELIPRSRQIAPDAPLLFAICAPCQSFTSYIQRNMTDGRSECRKRDLDLLSHTLGFIRKFKPDLVISENVASIRRSQHRGVWDKFRDELSRLGYIVGDDVVCASKFGIPQYRKRSVLMGIKKASDAKPSSSLPIPLCDPDAPSQLAVREAIGYLPRLKAGESYDKIPNHICRHLAEISSQRLKSVKPGEPNFVLSNSPFGDLSLACHRRLLDKEGKRGFRDVYTRIRPDRPSPTITTRFHSVSNGRFGHYDMGQVRGLSLREGAVLQSFRDDYEFYGKSKESIARMIGNAVPPKLSAYMARHLLTLWREAWIAKKSA